MEVYTLFKFLKLCLRSENVYSRIFLRVWFPCWGNNQDAHLDSGAEYWWDTRERLLLWKLNTVELILSIIEFRVTRSKLVNFYTSTVFYVGKFQLTPTLAAWPLRGHSALKSIFRETLFLDQLHDFSLLSLHSFLHSFLKSKFIRKNSLTPKRFHFRKIPFPRQKKYSKKNTDKSWFL